jgi:hypothetical protein
MKPHCGNRTIVNKDILILNGSRQVCHGSGDILGIPVNKGEALHGTRNHSAGKEQNWEQVLVPTILDQNKKG